MNNNEEIQELTIPTGQSYGKVSFTPEQGKIVRCVIYTGDKNNPGFIKAGIKGSGGNELSKLQPIQNYRSREVEYAIDGKPLKVNGGQLLTFEILATAPFTAPYLATLVLIYEKESTETCENY